MRCGVRAFTVAVAAVLIGSGAPGPVCAAEKVDLDGINRIVDEALNRPHVMETAAWLTDRIGGRLTNSPQMHEAQRWAQGRFAQWGLKNIRTEGFEFGRGWWVERASARMIRPRVLKLRSIPVAWTPSTAGRLAAPIVVAALNSPDDFDQWKGRLSGKIVLVSCLDNSSESTEAVQRFTAEDLRRMDTFEQPRHSQPKLRHRLETTWLFEQKRDAFLAAEGAVAWVRMADKEGGLLFGDARFGHEVGRTPKLPGVELTAEDYRRLARLATAGAEPVLELNNQVRYWDDDHNAYNVLADLPGLDPKAGYVMAGAHLDSWVASDGAADNAAGVAVVMEAARILSVLEVKARRTIRFALWSGEEQNGMGSLAYIERHLATRPPQSIAGIPHGAGWGSRFPITLKPGYDDLGAYFNVDYGSGKIRGLYAETNFAVVPIFREWLAPFASMGASSVAIRRIGSTDHVDFQNIGLPAFQFIQDPLDYFTRLHHSNVDTFDHLKAEDMRHNAVILAALLLMAAERDEPLPRMPLPQPPRDTDPFAYPDESP